MNRYFETLEDFNTYTENGTRITAGDLYFIKEEKMLLKTNNIDGTMQTYEMSGSGGGGEDNDFIPFLQKSATTITIPDGCTSIADNTFYYYETLEHVNIPEGVTSIGNSAFYYCHSLISVTIPDGVTSIGNSAFQSCSDLASINIPDSVTSIGNTTFNGCPSLTSIVIPNSVTSIGNAAFYGCSGLESMTVEATTPPTLVNANAFNNTNNCPIYVPAASVDTYKAAENWSTYADRIQAISE